MDALFHDPRHPYTRLLFAATPDLYGDDEVQVDPGRAAAARPADAGLPLPAALRPGFRAAAAQERRARPRSRPRRAPPATSNEVRRVAGRRRRRQAGTAAALLECAASSPATRSRAPPRTDPAPAAAVRCAPSRASTSPSRAGEILALVGESGLRQDHHGPDRDADGRADEGTHQLRRARTSRLSASASCVRSGARCRWSSRTPTSRSTRVPRPRLVAEPLADPRHRPVALRARRRGSSRRSAPSGLHPPRAVPDRFPHELSGGQRQRVAIAAAMVAEPRAARGRRAGLDARRLGPRGHPDRCWTPARDGLGDPDDHPRPVHRRALRRPHRGHVPGPDRRGGARARASSRNPPTRTPRR